VAVKVGEYENPNKSLDPFTLDECRWETVLAEMETTT
jgi:hypothetical protein